MRDSFADSLSKVADKNKKIYIVVADISPANGLNKFIKKNPNQFINVGVSEQLMIGICAGLAMRGKRAFAYTISTFSLYRPFEMIRNDICYQNLPVTIVGMGSGTVYANLGATHLSQEDISIAKSLPNMQIICPCDPLETSYAVEFCANRSKKPTYLRIGKAGEKNFTNLKTEKWKFGKIRKIKNGSKLAIISSGPIIKLSFEVSKKLLEKNIKPSIYNVHTIKPFDKFGIKKIFKKYEKIVVIEDHSEIGGLSEIIKVLAFEYSFEGKIESFSLKDQFIKCYSNQDDLLEKHGITLKNVLKKLKDKK
jgi:transketolase